MYNSLPSLHDVSQRFQSKGGKTLIDDIFEPLIRKHQLEAVVGVGLVHHHFSLNDGEMVVEFNHVSTPWVVDVACEEMSPNSGSSIVPSGWCIDAEKYVPYEFTYIPVGAAKIAINLDAPELHKFAVEFLSFVLQNELENIIALRAVMDPDSDGMLEITRGRTNINLKKGQVNTIT